MSYFMTTAGERIDISDLAPLELVEASKAQNYLQNIAPDISAADGMPLYLIHDGETGTSDDFVSAVYEHVESFDSLEGLVLSILLERLIQSKNSFRIWWANNRPDAWRAVADIDSPEELFDYVFRRARNGVSIVLAYRSTLRSGTKEPSVEL